MTTPLLDGLPPLVDERATVLILGSFPSVLSLTDCQYYANPRNAFWPIVGEIFGFDCTATYSRRVTELQSHGIALWDVLHSCRRTGSLDAAIDPKSLVANDFGALFVDYPAIRRIYFNGAKAAGLFQRVVPTCALPTQRLPSTSPAHAIPPARKRDAWLTIREDRPDS